MTKSLSNRSQAKFLAMLAIGLAAGWAVSASAEIPTNQVNIIPPGLVNYQGTLLTPANDPYTNGIYDIDFRVYPESSGGPDKALWGAGYKVFVNNGVFGVMLGQIGGAALNDNPTEFQPDELWKALWFDERAPDNLTLFLGITVKQDQNGNPIAAPVEALPRQQFLVTPFAARAQQAMYARRASGDFDVGGTLTATNGFMCKSASFDGTITATSFSGNGTNLTGVAKLAGGNSFSGTQTFETNVVARGNMQIGTDLYATSGEENLRIVRGSVWVTNNNPNMASSYGSGWSCGNPSNGVYHVFFDPPFSGVPTVTTTLWDARPYVINVAEVKTTDCWVRIYSDNENNLTELSFQFIAIGPR